MSIGNFPEILSQAMLVGTMLVGRLGVPRFPYAREACLLWLLLLLLSSLLPHWTTTIIIIIITFVIAVINMFSIIVSISFIISFSSSSSSSSSNSSSSSSSSNMLRAQWISMSHDSAPRVYKPGSGFLRYAQYPSNIDYPY